MHQQAGETTFESMRVIMSGLPHRAEHRPALARINRKRDGEGLQVREQRREAGGLQPPIMEARKAPRQVRRRAAGPALGGVPEQRGQLLEGWRQGGAPSQLGDCLQPLQYRAATA